MFTDKHDLFFDFVSSPESVCLFLFISPFYPEGQISLREETLRNLPLAQKNSSPILMKGINYIR